MPIAKITGQGLAAIAGSVALLWVCIIGEQVQRRDAFQERERVVREVRLMQRRTHSVPASDPSPFYHHRPHVAAG
jgi:hypothetical protein